jgi:hypothetical protein
MRFIFCTILILFPAICIAETRLAVLEFSGPETEAALLGLLSDGVRGGVLDATKGRVVDGEPIQVITRENMASMLEEMGEDFNTCQDECEVGLGRKIGADYVLSGEVVRVGSLFVLNIKLHETINGGLLAVETFRADDEGELMDGSRSLGAEAIGAGLLERMQKDAIQQEQVADWSPPTGIEVVVQFRSIPQGATVYVDGEYVCAATPCARHLREGKHSVRFYKQRYAEAKTVFSTEEQDSLLTELSPLFGVVEINSDPSNLNIVSNGALVGITPMRLELDPGNYVFEVADPCYQARNTELLVKSGTEQELALLPAPKKSALKVLAYSGSDAIPGDVYVDGSLVGRTAQNIELPLCSNVLEVLSTYGNSPPLPIDLVENEIVTIETNLPKSNPKIRNVDNLSVQERNEHNQLIDTPCTSQAICRENLYLTCASSGICTQIGEYGTLQNGGKCRSTPQCSLGLSCISGICRIPDDEKGIIVVVGGVDKIDLLRDEMQFAPGQLQPGEYQVWYQYSGSEAIGAGKIELLPGQIRKIKCDPTHQTCRW